METSQSFSENSQPKGGILSGIGMTASVACAVHCAATPFVLAFLPMSGGVMEESGFHILEPFMILIGAGLGLYFLLKTGKKSKYFTPRLAMLLCGLGLLLTSPLFEGQILHHILSFSGALMMAGSQFRPLFREKGVVCAGGADCSH